MNIYRGDLVIYLEKDDNGGFSLRLGEVKTIWPEDRKLRIDDWDTWELTVKTFDEVQLARVRLQEDLTNPDTGEIIAKRGSTYPLGYFNCNRRGG